MSEEKFWLLIAAIISLTVISVAGVIGGTIAYVRHQAFAAGYEQGAVPGVTGEVWVRPKPKGEPAQ